jgi:hypothetical protein
VQAPRPRFRHSDNINYFFQFTRDVGLPEIFCFELTDLYDAKNLPKVIYCIHALSHLLARRGLAEKIGNLVGKIDFTDEELQKKQKGLDAAGVAMPSFGNIGRQLAKEINEEPEPEPEPEETEEESQSIRRPFRTPHVACADGCFLELTGSSTVSAASGRRIFHLEASESSAGYPAPAAVRAQAGQNSACYIHVYRLPGSMPGQAGS